MPAQDTPQQDRSECNTPSNPDGLPAADCCGDETGKMMNGCPWESLLKKHRLIGLLVLAAVALMFLISQVGGILGIIAFFRTL